jgi:hypothetical protein
LSSKLGGLIISVFRNSFAYIFVLKPNIPIIIAIATEKITKFLPNFVLIVMFTPLFFVVIVGVTDD